MGVGVVLGKGSGSGTGEQGGLTGSAGCSSSGVHSSVNDAETTSDDDRRLDTDEVEFDD